MKLIKKGNSKIDKSCNVFNLPTSVCGVQCDRCYARKSEVRFPATLESRRRNYEASHRLDFVTSICSEIKKSKNLMFRIHESDN